MTRLQRCAIVSLSVVAACVVNGGSNQTNNPDAGKYDDYYSEKGGSSGGGGTSDGGGTSVTPTPHAVSSTKGVKAKVSKLIGKKKPVPGGTKPRPTKPPAPIEGLVFDGVVPTNAGVGSVVEILGSGFGSKPTDVTVTVGGKRQKVVEVAADHLLFKVDAKADGPIAIVRGGRPVARVKAGAGTAVPVRSIKSEAVFHVIAADSNFGKPRTDASHGLVANVYNIGKEVTELPAFDSLGEPIATYAVDSLDIPAAQFTGAFKSKDVEVTEWFAIHFKGSINITEAGTYNFCLAAGDGAQLYLDENLVVDNDGVHDTTEKCESVAVDPGEYKIDLLYFQAAAGEAGLQLSWAKDGGQKAIIPKENLFPPEDVATMARK